MKLYHGTLSSNVKSIMRHGLRPDTTYGYSCLARTLEKAEEYAEWFHPDEEVSILEISIDSESDPLWPDMHRLVEDQEELIETGVLRPGELSKTATWRDSLRWIGQCVYQGTVPPSKIRVAG